MKRVLLSYLLLQFALIPFLVSCNEDSDELPIEIELVTLNSAHEPASVFSHNDKIYFSLEIVNNSSNKVEWYRWCSLLQDGNMYKVFKIETDRTTYVGSPSEIPFACIGVPEVIVPLKGYYLQIPWDIDSSVQPLPVGNYKVEGDVVINIDGYKTFTKFKFKEFVIK